MISFDPFGLTLWMLIWDSDGGLCGTRSPTKLDEDHQASAGWLILTSYYCTFYCITYSILDQRSPPASQCIQNNHEKCLHIMQCFARRMASWDRHAKFWSWQFVQLNSRKVLLF